MQKKALILAGCIFDLFSFIQLIRVILKIEIIAAGHVIPVWISAVAFLILQVIGLIMFKAAFKKENNEVPMKSREQSNPR